MQLIDKIKETSNLVNLSTSTSTIKKQSNDLAKVNLYLKSKVEIINNYRESIINLNKLNSNEFPLEDFSYYINKITKIKKDNEMNIPISQNDFRALINGLEGKSEELKKQWNNYVINKTSQLINTLNCFKVLFENSNDITFLINKIELTQKKWPVNEGILTEFNSLINLSYDVINKLELTENIQDFIQMVVCGTATIEDLTPDIWEWAKKKKFTDKLFIGFKKL